MIDDLEKMINKNSQNIKDAKLEISKYDSELQDLLHVIENCNFNVVVGYKLAKAIKRLRIKRRCAKEKFHTSIFLLEFFSGKRKLSNLKTRTQEIKNQDRYYLRKFKSVFGESVSFGDSLSTKIKGIEEIGV